MVFKMAAVRHLGFLKFKFLTVGAVKKPICITAPNFVKISQTVTGISRFFVIFKMAVVANWDCQKFEILTVGSLYGANLLHPAKFHQNQSNSCKDMAI